MIDYMLIDLIEHFYRELDLTVEKANEVYLYLLDYLEKEKDLTELDDILKWQNK